MPSRGRPDAIAALARAVEATATAATALIVAVDLDDPTATDYPIVAADCPNLPGLLALERTTGAAEALNLVARRYAPGVRHLAFLPDAWRPIRPGWDTALVQALDSGYGFARGRETGPRMQPRHIAVRSELVGALGYLVPPGMPPATWSGVWARWGRTAGTAALETVMFDRDPDVPHRPAPGGPAGAQAWQQYLTSGQARRDGQTIALTARWRLSQV